MTPLDISCINTIRILSADAVQKAESGHPGMPMGAAAMAYALWMDHLRFDPADPEWPGRDRFILSAGHGSMLLYSLLYLTGYDLSLDDIKNFRQLDSKTPGHPEYHITPGVETTTGPLGQGFATGVGMAIAQKYLASVLNRQGYPLFDYRIFGIVSDGDLMEGISSEAASLAGHLKLGNIIYLYDDNSISIEGNTSIAFTEDAGERFKAFGWHVLTVEDGNDVESVSKAIEEAVMTSGKPSLIKVRTHIAFGSPNKVDSESAHGSPLGIDELKLTKINLGFDPGKDFFIGEDVLEHFRSRGSQGSEEHRKWKELYTKYSVEYTELSSMYEKFCDGKVNVDDLLPEFPPSESGMATRQASGTALNSIAKALPFMIGGSADLAPSNNTFLNGFASFQSSDYSGRNLHFGVREHAMGALLNGISLTKPMTAYGATFLIFSDYMRAAIRLAAIMKIRPVFVFTHDSVALGEDGTTHQPVEQLASLRAIPDLIVIRPADANETAEAWKTALGISDYPVALILTRQKVQVFDRTVFPPASEISKGAYVMKDCGSEIRIILIATGSEVQLALKASDALLEKGISARVVNMASWELFEMQSASYRESVLPKAMKIRIAVEAGSGFGWERYTGCDGSVIGINEFGKSAPGDVLIREYGFTVENLVQQAEQLLEKNKTSLQ
ncbi:MAG: transketolase [Ignavibacteria bacterium]|nr:transketolase [Ignavibacteria bacterium]